VFGAEDAVPLEARRTELLQAVEGGAPADFVFEAARSFFEAVARARTLVAVFEDVHWAEPAFLDLVEHVAATVDGAPLVVVCLARPELLDERPGWGGGQANALSLA